MPLKCDVYMFSLIICTLLKKFDFFNFLNFFLWIVNEKRKQVFKGKKKVKRSWKAKNLDFDTPKIFLQLFHNKIIPVLTAAPTDYFSSSHI